MKPETQKVKHEAWNVKHLIFYCAFQVSGFKLQIPSFRRGFTLLETIIALGVIMGAIIGPYTLATRGIITSSASKNKLMALNLAQEGIELVRRIRENNILAGSGWDAGISSGSWQMDVFASGLSPFNGAPLLYDSATGLFSHTAGVDSLFTRQITIEKPPASPTPGVPADQQIKVKSTATYTERGVNKTINLEEYFHNWQ